MRGTVRKMQCERNGGIATDTPAPVAAGALHMTEAAGTLSYFLPLDDQLLPMNGLIGRQIEIRASERITCVGCGKSSNKSFNQGYCYRCFIKLAACDRIEIELPHAGDITAVVIWASGRLFGCQFEGPVSPATLIEMVRRVSPGAKLTSPEGNAPPAKSAAAAGFVPENLGPKLAAKLKPLKLGEL